MSENLWLSWTVVAVVVLTFLAWLRVYPESVREMLTEPWRLLL
jgi:hypothetical protein